MADPTTPIVPSEKTTSVSLTGIKVTVRSVDLFHNATFMVDIMDSTGNLNSRQVVGISTEEYYQWKNDDYYILNLMATKLGFVLETPRVDPVDPPAADPPVDVSPPLTG
jgi:hypothetical protein